MSDDKETVNKGIEEDRKYMVDAVKGYNQVVMDEICDPVSLVEYINTHDSRDILQGLKEDVVKLDDVIGRDLYDIEDMLGTISLDCVLIRQRTKIEEHQRKECVEAMKTKITEKYELPPEYIDKFGVGLVRHNDLDMLCIMRPAQINILDPRPALDIQRLGPDIIRYCVSNNEVEVMLYEDGKMSIGVIHGKFVV